MTLLPEVRIGIYSDRLTAMLSDELPRVSDLPPLSVVTGPSVDMEQMLRVGEIDVALLPSWIVLRKGADFDVLPDISLSTWSNPFMTAYLSKGLECRTALIPTRPGLELAALLAAVVLQEGYGFSVDRLDEKSVDERRLETNQVVELRCDRPAGDADNCLDLGREWYELVNYPFVWGLFTTMKGKASKELAELLTSRINTIDEKRDSWIASSVEDVDIASYLRDEVRFQYDDLITASLTNLSEFLYFYGEVKEIPDIPVASFSDEEQLNDW